MRTVVRRVKQLQASQLSVQALSRLSSIGIFLMASWADRPHLALVAFQGALFAIPYTLVESLIGRPMSADVVPVEWDIEVWARRAMTAVVVPVGLVAIISASVALPGSSQVDHLIMITPIMLQLPLESLFWTRARSWSRRRTNLIPQLTAAGTLLAGIVLAIMHLRLDIATVPAQVIVLGWALMSRQPANMGLLRPKVWQSAKVGSVYCFAAAIDLLYSVALPSVAGALVGQTALVVLRAMDLAFGPFHVALSATTREDIVGGKKSRLLTGTRALTVVTLVVVSGIILSNARVRALLAADLTGLGTMTLTTYCGYKAFMMLSTWLATRHMIRVRPGQYLISALGSRVVAFSCIAISFLWVTTVPALFIQLVICEALIVCWFVFRIVVTTDVVSIPAVPVAQAAGFAASEEAL